MTLSYPHHRKSMPHSLISIQIHDQLRVRHAISVQVTFGLAIDMVWCMVHLLLIMFTSILGQLFFLKFPWTSSATVTRKLAITSAPPPPPHPNLPLSFWLGWNAVIRVFLFGGRKRILIFNFLSVRIFSLIGFHKNYWSNFDCCSFFFFNNCWKFILTMTFWLGKLHYNCSKRRSAWYNVCEVREKQRQKWRHHCQLKLAKSSHFPGLLNICTLRSAFKVALSFWFLIINMPNFFVETVFKLSQEDFLAVHRQNVDQIACLFLYVLLLEKAVFFLKNLKMASDPNFFSP